MIEKKDEAIQATNIQPATPDTNKTTPSLIPPLLCTIAYALCALLMAAPLNRAYDPVLRLQVPLGDWLTQAGAWLPANWGLGPIPRHAQTNTSMLQFLGLIALAFAVYGLCALYISRLPSESKRHRHTRIILWVGAALTGLFFVFTPAMLSHDILVYASYSRLLAIYHANPYFVPLAAFPHDPYVPLNYWAGAVSAYGPLWLGVCWLVGLVVGPQVAAYVVAFRLFALAVHLLNIWLVTRSLRTLGASPRIITLGALLYAWNPLVLFESGFGGHNDVFMLTFILLGIYLIARAQQRNTLTSPRGYLLPVVAFTLAALVKFTALPIIGLFLVFLAWNALRGSAATNAEARAQGTLQWEKAIIAVVIAGAAAGALALTFYGPFWIGHSISEIRNSFTSPPSAQGAENSILRSILAWVHDHGMPAQTLESKLISIFSIRKVWDALNIVLLAIVGLLGALWMWRSPTTRTFTLSALAAMGVLLIVTPWFFSWYVTWLVGLAAVALPVRQSRIGCALLVSALAFSASAFLTYLFLSGYPPFGIWTGLVCLTTITPPLLAFYITYLLWQPANNMHLSASGNVH
jgi:hypothetical protein